MNSQDTLMPSFEAAADATVTGDGTTLRSLLQNEPNLVKARSTRVHGATLLHYVAANGVEDGRQMSPANAVEIATLLLELGAEVDAEADFYGDKAATTMVLLVSSCHPAKTGVQVALVDTLLDFGAAINGPAGDGSPLLTALEFHYPDAAEALVRRGAAVDNMVKAAGLGRADLVAKFLPGESKANLDLGLVWAAMHHRNEVVELLLREGVQPDARDRRQWTALHWAAFHGYPDTVQLLLQGNAPLEAKNEFGASPLGQTIWITAHEGVNPIHLQIIQALVAAGSKIDPAWLRTDPPLDERVSALLR